MECQKKTIIRLSLKMRYNSIFVKQDLTAGKNSFSGYGFMMGKHIKSFPMLFQVFHNSYINYFANWYHTFF